MQFSTVAIVSLAAFFNLAVAGSIEARQNPKQYSVYVCRDADFQGGCFGVQNDYGNCQNVPSDFNDNISSLGGDLRTTCRAYADAACGGASIFIGVGEQVSRLPSLNDAISSVKCAGV